MAIFNQMWALQTRQKVIAKMRYMANNGQYTGGVPALGYQVVDKHLEICEPEAEIIREVFREYASGRSYREIIAKLNERGKRTKAGNAFGLNSLHDILKNEKYIGILYYGAAKKSHDGKRTAHNGIAEDAIRIDGGCPRIVDDETWKVVQEKMKKNKREQAGRPPMRDYPLKGKVFCGECGSVLTVSRSQNKYYYYGCERKHRDGSCSLPKIGAPKLEGLVADAVRGLIGRPGCIDGLIEIMREERNKLVTGAPERLQTLIAEKASTKKKLDTAVDAILEGLNSESLRQRIETLEAELKKIDADMTKLRSDVTAAGISDEALRKGLQKVMDRSNGDDAAVLTVVARVEVFEKDIRIWTLLDTDFDGKIDFGEAGKVIKIDGDGLPAPRKSTLRRAFLRIALNFYS